MASNDEEPPFEHKERELVSTFAGLVEDKKEQRTGRSEYFEPETSGATQKIGRDGFRRRTDYNSGHEPYRHGAASNSHKPSSRPRDGSHSSSEQQDRHYRNYDQESRYAASAPSSESYPHYPRPPYPSQYPPHQQSSYTYGMRPPPQAQPSSSFESHGRHPGSLAPPGAYAYPPPPGYPHYQWTQLPPIEYITNIKPSDVLSGRGGATNSHSGNRVFRSLVKKYQDQYLKAKKRDKPAVASIIVEKIRERGGRFLRKGDTTPQGQVLWIDIGDDRAREKTCQALREGAPEIRRKRKTSSADEEDTSKKESDGDMSPSSSIDRTASTDEGPAAGHHSVAARRTPIERNASMAPGNPSTSLHYQFPRDGPIMIRPSQSLIFRRRIPEAISVDQLAPQDRDLYLRDFLPPDPAIQQNMTKKHVMTSSASPLALSPSRPSDNASPWKMVKV